jgi:hypothetical protein
MYQFNKQLQLSKTKESFEQKKYSQPSSEESEAHDFVEEIETA